MSHSHRFVLRAHGSSDRQKGISESSGVYGKTIVVPGGSVQVIDILEV